MGTLRTKTIEPATGSTLTLGASGDTITVSSDSIKVNTFKDAGGNTLFTSDGAGTLSSVNAGLQGGAGPILISTATASNAASIAITSGIDSTYDEYMFVFTDIHPETDRAYFKFQVNAAGGSGYDETITSTAFAAYHQEDDGGTPAVAYKSSNDQAQGSAYQILDQELDADNDSCTAGILHLFSPSSTTYVKQFYSRLSTSLDGGEPYSNDSFIAGYINTTSAIDEISFKFSSGNMNGTIQMYGIK